MSKPKRRIGSQAPRFLYRPVEPVDNYGEMIAYLLFLGGSTLDPWQELATAEMTGVAEHGGWTALEAVFLAPRQNGKSEIIVGRALLGLFVLGEEISFSAHKYETAVLIFERIKDLVESTPIFSREVVKIRESDSARFIQTRKGIFRVSARKGDGGRGLSGDLIIFDEAGFNLSPRMVAALLPSLAAKSMTGRPQVWYLSSTPPPTADVLNSRRNQVITEDDELVKREDGPDRLLFIEWSTSKFASSTDREGWYESNPALGIRISEDYVEAEYEAFLRDPSRGEVLWRQERLGIPEVIAAEDAQFLNSEWWEGSEEKAVVFPPEIQLAVAVDVPPSRDRAVISVAAYLEEDRYFIDLLAYDVGLWWVPERLKHLQQTLGFKHVIVDAQSSAKAIIPDIEAEGVKTLPIATADYAASCARFEELLAQGQLVHIGQEPLNTAVEYAQPRYIGDTGRFVWKRKNSLADISPMVGVTLALWGLDGQKRIGTKKKRRRVVIPR